MHEGLAPPDRGPSANGGSVWGMTFGSRPPRKSHRFFAVMALSFGSLTLSGCLGQFIIGNDVDPWLGHRWQDYDYAHPDAACGKPYENKYGQKYVTCSTDQYTVTFHVDEQDVIRSYSGELR